MFIDVLFKTVWEDLSGPLTAWAVITLASFLFFDWRGWWAERPWRDDPERPGR